VYFARSCVGKRKKKRNEKIQYEKTVRARLFIQRWTDAIVMQRETYINNESKEKKIVKEL